MGDHCVLRQAETEVDQLRQKIKNGEVAIYDEAEKQVTPLDLAEGDVSAKQQSEADPVIQQDDRPVPKRLQTLVEPEEQKGEQMFPELFKEYGIPVKDQARFEELFEIFRAGEESGPIRAELKGNGTDRDSVMERFWEAETEDSRICSSLGANTGIRCAVTDTPARKSSSHKRY